MNNIQIQSPKKYLIKDLKNMQVPFEVWLQGKLENTENQDVIISDGTGEVRVKGSDCDKKVKTLGGYYCVIGIAVSTEDKPEIKAAKFFKISSIHQKSWEFEVQEAQLLLQGLVTPKLETNIS